MTVKATASSIMLLFLIICSHSNILADELAADSIIAPELKATRITGNAPTIDGDLSDLIWQTPGLEFARNFIERAPGEGTPATESTTVAILYDDDALYFAFWCYDSQPDKIVRQLVRRDRSTDSDQISVRIDPYHDHQTGYRLELFAAGTQRDLRLYNDTDDDETWDGIWQSGVKAQPWGWSAEIRIPFQCLRFAEKDDQTWGINLCRYICREAESDWWAFAPSSKGGFVSNFGHLAGLSGIKPSEHLEIMPYVVGSIETEPESQGNPDGRDYMENAGFDLKYGLASNFIIDATVNPDFGQVELDEPVLNLTAYETYYDEKRPFFMEGANLFDTPFELFYSRRIGRQPYGSIDDPDLDYYVDYPNAVTILEATKVTGKFKNGMTIAVLNALTQEEKAEYRTTSGETKTGTVETMADYSIVRLQQDILSKSNIGAMFTLASQDDKYPVSTGGIDWNLLTKDGCWSFYGQTVYSRTDADTTGYGFTSYFEKAAGDHWRGDIGYTYNDRKLDLNHLGYLSRNDEQRTNIWLQYHTNDDRWIFRKTYYNFNAFAGWNLDDYNIEKGWNINYSIEFINNWNNNGGYEEDHSEYDDYETRGNGLWEMPSSWDFWINTYTDERKNVVFGTGGSGGHARDGSWWHYFADTEYRPASNIELQLTTGYTRTFDEVMWVTNEDDNSIFADMDQDELSLTLTAGILLTRDLSLQLSGQGYISGVDYSNYRRYLGGSSYESYTLDEQDFNYSALNSTFILRWEYRAGSTLYLVWTRAMSEDNYTINNLEFSRDFKNLFSGDANNVFLAKISYWWNL